MKRRNEVKYRGANPLWFLFLEVEAVAGNERLSRGEKAFVNVAAPGGTAKQAENNAAAVLGEVFFRIVRVEDVFRTTDGRKSQRQLASLEKKARKSNRAELGTFHTWDDQG